MAETKIRLTQTNLDAETNKITSVADGTIASDAVNKGQLDTAVTGVLVLAKMIYGEVPTGAVDGVNTTYTLANTPETGTVRVYLNGQRLKEGVSDDYTISGLTLTMASAPKVVLSAPDKILVDYISQ